MAISVDQYSASGTTNVSTLLKNNNQKSDKGSYSEDVVSISQEALELVAELRNKKNKTYVTTEMEAVFARVAGTLPNSEGFNDMLNLLTGWAKGSDAAVSKGKVEEPDRNIYAKDPTKYSEMWKELFENYNGLIKSLKLDPKNASDRKILTDPSVSLQVRARFAADLSSDAKQLLKFFNINMT